MNHVHSVGWVKRRSRATHLLRATAILFALSLLPALADDATVTRDGVTLTQPQETRAENIGDQFRCLVCQNESIEASGAALAKQLRVIIRQHIIAGDSNAEITAFMVQRYGIFILLKPPFSPITALLYASPIAALLLGFALFLLGRRTKISAPAPLTAADESRLCELLTETDK